MLCRCRVVSCVFGNVSAIAGTYDDGGAAASPDDVGSPLPRSPSDEEPGAGTRDPADIVHEVALMLVGRLGGNVTFTRLLERVVAHGVEEAVARESEAEARKILLQIVDAICCCHMRGIVHRDLKLENVLFKDTED